MGLGIVISVGTKHSICYLLVLSYTFNQNVEYFVLILWCNECTWCLV